MTSAISPAVNPRDPSSVSSFQQSSTARARNASGEEPTKTTLPPKVASAIACSSTSAEPAHGPPPAAGDPRASHGVSSAGLHHLVRAEPPCELELLIVPAHGDDGRA